MILRIWKRKKAQTYCSQQTRMLSIELSKLVQAYSKLFGVYYVSV